MARWKDAVRYAVADLSTPDRHLGIVEAGFYWFIPLDADQAPEGMPEDHKVSFVGPYGTHDEARDAALAWIHEQLATPIP